MKFTEHLPEHYSAEVAKRKAEYTAHWEKSGGDPLQAMCDVVMRELERKPTNYLKFGLYWWALKQVLIRADRLPESLKEDDAEVRGVYVGGDDIETIILAYIHKEEYESTRFRGGRKFSVGGEDYSLFDLEAEYPVDY